MARLIASVPLPVTVTSNGMAPMAAASLSRPSSHNRRDFCPSRWVAEAFPRWWTALVQASMTGVGMGDVAA